MQEQIEDEWIKDEEDEGEVIKLEEGDDIKGVLMKKQSSFKYGYIYKIKIKDDDVVKVICGTIVLNDKMDQKNVGDEIRILRMKDKVNNQGVAYHDYETFHKT